MPPIQQKWVSSRWRTTSCHLDLAVAVVEAADVGLDQVLQSTRWPSVIASARRPSYSMRRLSWNAQAIIWPSMGTVRSGGRSVLMIEG